MWMSYRTGEDHRIQKAARARNDARLLDADRGHIEGRDDTVSGSAGLFEPKTTTVLVAPYRVGAVEQLCEGDPDRFGNRHLDWSGCTFTTTVVE